MNSSQHNTEIQLLETCYRRFLCGMTCYACKFVPEYVASDIVQDVFLKLWQTNRAFYHLQNPREQQLYLYRCINNACYDWIKHNNIVANHSGPIATDIRNEEIYWYERLIENEDFQCKVKRILQEVDTLPDRCREIFSRRYIKQQKPSEIALELGISVRTVEAQLYKALNVLRKNLNEKK